MSCMWTNKRNRLCSFISKIAVAGCDWWRWSETSKAWSTYRKKHQFSQYTFFHPLTAWRYACQSQSVVVRYSVQWAYLISSKRFPRDQNVCFHRVFLFTLTFAQGSYRKFDSTFKDTIGRPKFEGETSLICTHKLKNREISFLLAAISCS